MISSISRSPGLSHVLNGLSQAALPAGLRALQRVEQVRGLSQSLGDKETTLLLPLQGAVEQILEEIKVSNVIKDGARREAAKVLKVLRNQPFLPTKEKKVLPGTVAWLKQELFSKELTIAPIVAQHRDQVLDEKLDPFIKELSDAFSLGQRVVSKISGDLLVYQSQAKIAPVMDDLIQEEEIRPWVHLGLPKYSFQSEANIERHLVSQIVTSPIKRSFALYDLEEAGEYNRDFAVWSMNVIRFLSQSLGSKELTQKEIWDRLGDACKIRKDLQLKLGVNLFVTSCMFEPPLTDMIIKQPS